MFQSTNPVQLAMPHDKEENIALSQDTSVPLPTKSKSTCSSFPAPRSSIAAATGIHSCISSAGNATFKFDTELSIVTVRYECIDLIADVCFPVIVLASLDLLNCLV